VAKQSGPTTTRDAMTVALEEQATAGETEDEAEDEPDAKKRKGARDKARRVEE